MKWWCTPCNTFRVVKRLAIGPICTQCGSGRCRPPLPHETEEARL